MKWEYLIESLPRRQDVSWSAEKNKALLQQRGQEQWELVAVTQDAQGYAFELYFKRPKL